MHCVVCKEGKIRQSLLGGTGLWGPVEDLYKKGESEGFACPSDRLKSYLPP